MITTLLKNNSKVDISDLKVHKHLYNELKKMGYDTQYVDPKRFSGYKYLTNDNSMEIFNLVTDSDLEEISVNTFLRLAKKEANSIVTTSIAGFIATWNEVKNPSIIKVGCQTFSIQKLKELLLFIGKVDKQTAVGVETEWYLPIPPAEIMKFIVGYLSYYGVDTQYIMNRKSWSYIIFSGGDFVFSSYKKGKEIKLSEFISVVENRINGFPLNDTYVAHYKKGYKSIRIGDHRVSITKITALLSQINKKSKQLKK